MFIGPGPVFCWLKSMNALVAPMKGARVTWGGAVIKSHYHNSKDKLNSLVT